VELGAALGRVSGTWQHVSATNVHTVFEVIYDNRSYLFSELDRDAFGVRLGVERAKQLAEEKLASLTAQVAKAEKRRAVPEPILETRVVPEITIYVTSERGSLQAIDGETGKTKWVVGVGRPSLITSPPAANDDFVAVLNGSTLYVLKAEDGTPAWHRPMTGAPGAGPAMSSEYVFVPMINGKVEVYRTTEPRRPEFVYQSFGRLLVQPVSNQRSVAWASDRGILYVASGAREQMRFKVTTNDEIVAPPAFLPPDRVLVGSIDGYLYCVSEKNGDIFWKFSTGQPIHQAPFGSADTAYVINDDGGLFAINVADGSEKWWTTGYRRYLANTGDRLYVTDISGSLVILDARSGARIGAVPIPDLDYPVANLATDRLLIGTRSGLLQMLRETRNRWPVMQANIEFVKKKPAEAQAAPGAAAPEKKDEKAPMADPFEDPFGAAPKAKAAPKPMEDDPFK
jgi:outer membrane protein assembly factor BamB